MPTPLALSMKVRLSSMMFLQFFIWGAWFVTLSTYLGQTLSFEGTDIGRSYLMNNIGAMIAPFFIGMIADRFFSSQKVMGVLHLLGAVLIWQASSITEVTPFILVILGYNLCYMPTLALVNTISFHQLESSEKQFPAIRVWGTIGWIVAGLTLSLLENFGMEGIEATSFPLKLAAMASVLLGIYSFFLPDTPPKMKGQQVTIGEILGLKALKLFKDKSFSIFVLSSFLISIPLAFYYGFANLYFNESGMTETAAKMTMGQLSEVFFMLLIPWFFSRLGVKKMLLFGMLAWVLRYALFAMGNNDTLVWMFYAGILLHGICYDFFFVTGQIYVDNKAPKEIRASAQGLITLITYGFGLGLGSEIAGQIVTHFTADQIKDWATIWWIPAAFALFVMLLFTLIFKEKEKVKA